MTRVVTVVAIVACALAARQYSLGAATQGFTGDMRTHALTSAA
jgi:hypothetical protein